MQYFCFDVFGPIRGAVFDDFGAVGRSVGQSGARSVGPPSPLAPEEVWSDIASSVEALNYGMKIVGALSSVWELSLVWRSLV